MKCYLGLDPDLDCPGQDCDECRPADRAIELEVKRLARELADLSARIREVKRGLTELTGRPE